MKIHLSRYFITTKFLLDSDKTSNYWEGASSAIYTRSGHNIGCQVWNLFKQRLYIKDPLHDDWILYESERTINQDAIETVLNHILPLGDGSKRTTN